MAYTINQVFLAGNLAADPDFKVSQNGNGVLSFTVTTSYGEKQADGTWENKPEYHKCVAFGKMAEAIAPQLSKGARVTVRGRLRTRKWQDKQGTDRYTTEVLSDDVILGSNQANKQAEELF